MKYTGVVKRSGRMVWRYRALWLFGALLALTTAGAFPFMMQFNHEGEVTRIPVRITPQMTIYLPGDGLRIDLTVPGGFFIETDQDRWTSVGELLDDIGPVRMPTDGWIILGVAGGVFLVTLLVGAVVRYVSETALIRMMSETEETGKTLSVRQGLRRGFSRPAWRIFLIDLALQVPAALALLLLVALALSPLLLWLTASDAAGVMGSLFTVGLLVLFAITAFVVWVGLSLLLPLARRACAVDGLGVGASIRRAAGLAKGSFGGVGAIWLTWIGVRLAWTAAVIVVAILLSPILLLALVAGTVAGGLVAVAVGGLLSLFWVGASPWIVGAVVGLPILILVLLIPIAFVRGLVEVFLSGIWTLAYRELRPAESQQWQPVPQLDTAGVAAVQGAT
jgi:hypothetical protein